jgi:hypothetical protein
MANTAFVFKASMITCDTDDNSAKYLNPAFVPDPAVRYRWFAGDPAVVYNKTIYPMRLYCREFPVIRQTAKTEWLDLEYGATKRQLRYAVRKFAHTHPGAALYSFIRKRGRWLARLRSQLRHAEAVMSATAELAKTTDLSKWKNHPDEGVDYPIPEDYSDGGYYQ